MRCQKSIIFGALMVLVVGVSSAEEQDMTGWYLGVGAGTASTEIQTSEVESPVDESSTAVRLFGGYRAGKYFAVELGIGDFGEISTELPSGDRYEAALSALDVNLFGILPIADGVVDLFAKVGIMESEIRETVVGGEDPVRKVDTNSTDYLVGAGVQLNFLADRSLGVRLDYSVRDAKTPVESFDTWSLSVLYRF